MDLADALCYFPMLVAAGLAAIMTTTLAQEAHVAWWPLICAIWIGGFGIVLLAFN